MKTIYVNKRIGLTGYKEFYERADMLVYRTRATCQCAEGQNRRNAIIVITGNYVIAKVIQCKACVQLQKGVLHE